MMHFLISCAIGYVLGSIPFALVIGKVFYKTDIRKLGSRIVTIHVSDYDLLDEKHWLPGEGKADWKGIITTLREIGYKGPWLYELEFDLPPSATINRRLLTTEDFRENYDTLMKLEIPKAIGEPIEELCTQWLV